MRRYLYDPSALRANVRVCRELVENAKIYGVVKGDGYGLGVLSMARALREEGVNAFAVTEIAEARALREAGFTDEEILMLRPFLLPSEIEALLPLNVVFTVDSSDTAAALNATAEKNGTTALAHIKIDVGMGRYGFDVSETDKVKAVYKYFPKIAVMGIFTHFPTAFAGKKTTREQFDRFMSVVYELRNEGFAVGVVHCANSSAALRFDYTRLDAVRLGSALLGRLSFRARKNLGLKKIGCAEATVQSVRWLQKGETTGYGSVWKARRPTRTAVLDIGYFHGFGLTRASEPVNFTGFMRGCLSLFAAWVTGRKAVVYFGDKKARVLGKIGMLHTVVDVTGLDARPGDAATLDVSPIMIKSLDVFPTGEGLTVK